MRNPIGAQDIIGGVHTIATDYFIRLLAYPGHRAPRIGRVAAFDVEPLELIIAPGAHRYDRIGRAQQPEAHRRWGCAEGVPGILDRPNEKGLSGLGKGPADVTQAMGTPAPDEHERSVYHLSGPPLRATVGGRTTVA